MKKILTFTADRTKVLTLENLSEFVANCEELDFRLNQSPKIVLQKANTVHREAGQLIQISAEKQVYG